MKPMKLRDVQDITQHPRHDCRRSLMTWHNTREDWLRRETCIVLLRQRARRKAS